MKFSVHPIFAKGFFSERSHPKLSHTGFVSTENQAKSEFFQPRTERTEQRNEREAFYCSSSSRSFRPCWLSTSGLRMVRCFFFPGGWLMNREVSNKWYAKPTPLIGSNSKVVLFIIFTRGKITLFLVRRGDYTTWFLGIAITMN